MEIYLIHDIYNWYIISITESSSIWYIDCCTRFVPSFHFRNFPPLQTNTTWKKAHTFCFPVFPVSHYVHGVSAGTVNEVLIFPLISLWVNPRDLLVLWNWWLALSLVLKNKFRLNCNLMDLTSQVQGVIHCLTIVTWMASGFDLWSFWDQGQSWNDRRKKGSEVFRSMAVLYESCCRGSDHHSRVLFDIQKPRWHHVMVKTSACVVNPPGFVCDLWKTTSESQWALVFERPLWEGIKSSEYHILHPNYSTNCLQAASGPSAFILWLLTCLVVCLL